MADDQDASNEEGAEAVVPSRPDATTAALTPDSGNPLVDENVPVDDYVDEPIEDYVVKLVVNESPDGVGILPEVANTLAADMRGTLVPEKITFSDSLNELSSTAYNELSGDGAGITGSKRWWGWSTQKFLIFGVIALLILAIILAILFIVLRKKFSKNKKGPATAGSSTTTKQVVNKGIDPKYQSVQTA